MRVNPLTPKSIYFLLKISPLNHAQRSLDKTSNNQRLVKCVQSLIRDFFNVLIAQKKSWCFQLKAAKKTFAHEIEAI